MNTTTATPDTFTPTSLYYIPSLGIKYDIQFSSHGRPLKARVRDTSGYVSDWLEVVPEQEGSDQYIIDPYGYALAVGYITFEDRFTAKRPRRRIYYRVFDHDTGRYMCSGYNCRSLADLKKSMLSYFSIDHDESELKAISKDFVPYLDTAGFSVECEERFRPFPKSHVYN